TTVLLPPANSRASGEPAHTRWQVRGLPTTLVLNQRGEIVYRAVGEREWDDAVLLHQLQTLQPESRKLD
ncbi:MAG: hypothetical protein ABW141_04250, partial [Candidatus Thiodiazotropha endolucinida]